MPSTHATPQCKPQSAPQSTRRQFVQDGASWTAAGVLSASLASRAYAGGGDVIRVGLVGCGGRGTGAAMDALHADSNVQLVAAADLFKDNIDGRLQALQADPEVGGRVAVPEDARFTGFDGYRQVIDLVDVVILATTPHFRPMHLKYAVQQDTHAFVEKPVATDPAGTRDIMATCEVARSKGLCIVSGLCYRYEHKKRETIQKIHQGAIGDIITCETNYLTGPLWHRSTRPDASEMEKQQRNWYYYTWLSGDHIVEQHIHSLDKIAWVMGDEPPIQATATGGRIQRNGEQWGNIYDHFSTVFTYANGVKAYSTCRQMSGTTADVSDTIYGSRGTAQLNGRPGHRISDQGGETVWLQRRDGAHQGSDNMYRNEHIALFAAIRSGDPINDGDYMCKSTLMAIMARESAYSGQTLTWDQVRSSPLDLSPAQYAWGDAPQRPVRIPGEYQFPVAQA